jgi:hypothetical protein
MAGKLFMLWLGLAAGNALFALLQNGPIEKIVERSFFQGVALAAAWYLLRR